MRMMMKILYKNKRSYSIILLQLILFPSLIFSQHGILEKKMDEYYNNKKILARVLDREITLDEFLKRAEYTIRPNYCKGNSNIEKKIILNSLIGEKLLAIEKEKESELLRNDRFKRIIQEEKNKQCVIFSPIRKATVKFNLIPMN